MSTLPSFQLRVDYPLMNFSHESLFVVVCGLRKAETPYDRLWDRWVEPASRTQSCGLVLQRRTGLVGDPTVIEGRMPI